MQARAVLTGPYRPAMSPRCFATKAEARREVARFIDWYNCERKHSTCEMLSPIDYEAMLTENADAA